MWAGADVAVGVDVYSGRMAWWSHGGRRTPGIYRHEASPAGRQTRVNLRGYEAVSASAGMVFAHGRRRLVTQREDIPPAELSTLWSVASPRSPTAFAFVTEGR